MIFGTWSTSGERGEIQSVKNVEEHKRYIILSITMVMQFVSICIYDMYLIIYLYFIVFYSTIVGHSSHQLNHDFLV